MEPQADTQERKNSSDYEIFEDCSNHFKDEEWDQRISTGTLLYADPTLLHESLLMGIPS